MNSDDEVGSGAFGRVFRAKLPPSICGYNAAFKRLKNNASAKERKYFLEEIELLKATKHKNILRLLGICKEPLGYLTELCDDHLKYSILKKLTLGEKIFIAREVANGVAYLHSKITTKDNNGSEMILKPCILHRDLKAANILLKNNGKVVKIADFGLAKTINSLALATTLNIGTPTHQAPELMMNHIDNGEEERRYDDKCDVYSFAMVLYEILTGMNPFDELRTDAAVYKAVMAKKRPRLNAILDADKQEIKQLTQTMIKCWSQEPNDRPSMQYVSTEISSIHENFASSSDCASASSLSFKLSSSSSSSSASSRLSAEQKTPDLR